MDAPGLFEGRLLLVGAVLLLAVLAGLAARRLSVPVRVAFLALGMLLGSEGPGGIHFDDPDLPRSIGVVALIVIPVRGRPDDQLARRPADPRPGGPASSRLVLHPRDPLFEIVVAKVCLGTPSTAPESFSGESIGLRTSRRPGYSCADSARSPRSWSPRS